MLDELEKELDQFFQQENNRRLEEFEGYSPGEMSEILYNLFGKQSPVQFNNFSSDDCHQIPIFNLVSFTLKKIEDRGEIKLTKTGALSIKLVAEMYAQGFYKEYHIESGLVKLYKESDSYSIKLTKILMEVAGLTKKRKGKLSLTKKGQKLMHNDPELLKLLLITYCSRINWAYFDGYEDERIGRLGVGFSLILLAKYGAEKRSVHFYATKYFKAFPMLIDHATPPNYGTPESYASNCYNLRTHHYFFQIFGLIHTETVGFRIEDNQMITKQKILDELIRCIPPGNSKNRKD